MPKFIKHQSTLIHDPSAKAEIINYLFNSMLTRSNFNLPPIRDLPTPTLVEVVKSWVVVFKAGSRHFCCQFITFFVVASMQIFVVSNCSSLCVLPDGRSTLLPSS